MFNESIILYLNSSKLFTSLVKTRPSLHYAWGVRDFKIKHLQIIKEDCMAPAFPRSWFTRFFIHGHFHSVFTSGANNLKYWRQGIIDSVNIIRRELMDNVTKRFVYCLEVYCPLLNILSNNIWLFSGCASFFW